MATFRRATVAGGTYFFTLATYCRQPLLTLPEIVTATGHAIRSVRAEFPFELVAMVLLPDHLHAIWTLPPDDADYPRRWALIKRHIATEARRFVTVPLTRSMAKRHETGVWQRRYWEHLIRDDVDLQRHVDYIHINPVKHGYVKHVVDWPHSTFHRYVKRGIRPRDWAAEVASGQFGEVGQP
ncbi:MAG: transposase [Rhodanobacteraceae bacterium]|jgi:putative transposase|nr:MAG: transposase [Rhodanobacteraceae bacterium]